MHHRHHHHGWGHGPRGFFRGGFPNRHELADIADVLTHLRDRQESQPQPQG